MSACLPPWLPISSVLSTARDKHSCLINSRIRPPSLRWAFINCACKTHCLQERRRSKKQWVMRQFPITVSARRLANRYCHTQILTPLLANAWRTQLHAIDDHHPSRTLPEQFDVAIIGAWMAGVLTACYLCKQMGGREPSIVMLEAREVCSGATDRNGVSMHGLKDLEDSS